MENNSLAKNISKGIRGRLRFLSENPYRKVNVNWLTLKYYKHLPPGKLRTHRLFGQLLYFYSATELLHGFEEIFIQEIYKQSLGEKPYILDCGANIGLSVIYLKHQFPDAEIVAFEPDEKNFDLLSRNIKSFGYTGITLCKEAVWKEQTILHFSNEGSMSSKIQTGQHNGTVSVPAIRLKDRINRPIDFLKIDIEGAEYEVLRDIADDLHFVNNLFLEYHGSFAQNRELTELFNIIQSCGFNYYIKEATSVYATPFYRKPRPGMSYDVQLNIFCFRQ